MNKKLILLFIALSLLALIAQNIHAAEDVFKFEDIFEPLKGLDIPAAYGKYPYLIDSIIYFIFFIGIAQLTLAQRFAGRGGKIVIIAFGVALSIAMSYWSKSVGFKLGSLGPLAATIFAVAAAILIWRLFHHQGTKLEAVWIGFLAVYLMVHMFFPQLITVFKANKYGNMAYGISHLLFIVAIIAVLFGIGGMLRRGSPADLGGGNVLGPGTSNSPVAPATPRQRKRRLRNLFSGMRSAKGAEGATRKAEEVTKSVEKSTVAEIKGEEQILKILDNLIKDLLQRFPDRNSQQITIPDEDRKRVEGVLAKVSQWLQERANDSRTRKLLFDFKHELTYIGDRITTLIGGISDPQFHQILNQLKQEGNATIANLEKYEFTLIERIGGLSKLEAQTSAFIKKIITNIGTLMISQSIDLLRNVQGHVTYLLNEEINNEKLEEEIGRNLEKLDEEIIKMYSGLAKEEKKEAQATDYLSYEGME